MKIIIFFELLVAFCTFGCVTHQPVDAELWRMRLEGGATGSANVYLRRQPPNSEGSQKISFNFSTLLTGVEGYSQADVWLSIAGVLDNEGNFTANVSGSGNYENAGFSARYTGTMRGELLEQNGHGKMSLLCSDQRGMMGSNREGSFQNHTTWYLEKVTNQSQ